MLSVINKPYAECQYAEYSYAQCRGTFFNYQLFKYLNNFNVNSFPGNTNWRGMLSTIDLLIRAISLVSAVNDFFQFKNELI